VFCIDLGAGVEAAKSLSFEPSRIMFEAEAKKYSNRVTRAENNFTSNISVV